MNKEITIDECIKKLKEITEKLSAPDITIEESIALYEEGKKYSDRAKEALSVYREKIDVINTEESNEKDE